MKGFGKAGRVPALFGGLLLAVAVAASRCTRRSRRRNPTASARWWSPPRRPGSKRPAPCTPSPPREIQERGARTLDEALTLVPGLFVRTGGEGSPRIDIRGFRTRHVQLLLDGIPINSTFDGQFDPSTIGVENIAAIKVTTGGGSVLYGEGGNGGVINIITKKGPAGTARLPRRRDRRQRHLSRAGHPRRRRPTPSTPSSAAATTTATATISPATSIPPPPRTAAGA